MPKGQFGSIRHQTVIAAARPTHRQAATRDITVAKIQPWSLGLSEFRRQLCNKGAWYGCKVLIANRYYPSSKRISSCGQVNPDLALNEHAYFCQYCGLVIDRDLNAAINLEQLLSV